MSHRIMQTPSDRLESSLKYLGWRYEKRDGQYVIPVRDVGAYITPPPMTVQRASKIIEIVDSLGGGCSKKQ